MRVPGPMTSPSTAAAATVAVFLRGAPRLVRGDGGLRMLERKDAALLALLALDGPAPRARLALLLWPEVDAERARNNLRQRLFRLRRLAGRAVVDAGEVLALADGIVHDLAALAEDAAGSAADLLGTLDYTDCAALADWIAAARARLRRQRRTLLARRAERLAQDGRIAAALVAAEELVADDPLAEDAVRLLMRLHAARGDHAAARAAYQRMADALAQQLDAHPSAESRLLLERIVGGTPATRAPAVLRPPRLIGRDREWRQLEDALRAGAGVLILGEPGIGKSRLLAEFCAAGDALAAVSARPGDAVVPYATLARLVRVLLARCDAPAEPWARAELARLAPELGAAPAGDLNLVRLVHALVRLVLRARAAGLRGLALDDLHYADAASLEALGAMAGHEEVTGLHLLAGARRAELPDALREWRVGQSGLSEIHLGPLDRDGVGALLASLALPDFDADAWAAPMFRHTGGVPLFVLETLRAVLGGATIAAPGAALPAPETLNGLIARRLAQLSAPALQLARVAALAAQDFGIELAASVLACHPLDLAPPWRELEAAQIIRDDAFAHDLIFEATVRAVPPDLARTLHHAIATHLQAGAAAPARIARHWQAAGVWPRAADAFARAADLAHAASRRADELACREAAIENMRRAGRADAAFQLARANIETVLLVKGAGAARAAVDALEAGAVTLAQRIEVQLARAHTLLAATDQEGARAAAGAAIALAAGEPFVRQRFEACVLLALSLAQLGEADAALAALQPLAAQAASGSLRQRFDYWSARSYALQTAGRRRLCAEAVEQAIELAEALGDFAEVMTSTSNLAIIESQLGRYDAALRLQRRALAMRERLGEVTGVPAYSVVMNLGVYCAATGAYREALAHLETALQRFRAASEPTWVTVAENQLAVALLFLGQPARARRVLTEVPAAVLTSTRARRLLVEARIERALGKSGARSVGKALATLGPGGEAYMRAVALLEKSYEDAPDEAAQSCARVATEAGQGEHRALAIKARFLRAWHLSRAGRHPEAAAEARLAAAESADALPGDMYAPEAHWIAFQVFDAAGDPAAARAQLQDAVRWINERALPNVPSEYRDGFLDRNAINRAILTTAGRRL